MVFSTKKKKLKPKMDLEKALSILFRSEKGSPAMPCSEKGSPAMLRSVKPSPRWTSSRLVRSFKSLALAFTVIVTLLQTAEAIEYTEDKNLYFGAAYMVDKSCHLSAFIMQGSRGFSFEFDTSDDNPDKNIKFFNKDEGQAEICFSTDHAVVPLYDGFIVMVMSKMKEDQPKPFHYQLGILGSSRSMGSVKTTENQMFDPTSVADKQGQWNMNRCFNYFRAFVYCVFSGTTDDTLYIKRFFVAPNEQVGTQDAQYRLDPFNNAHIPINKQWLAASDVRKILFNHNTNELFFVSKQDSGNLVNKVLVVNIHNLGAPLRFITVGFNPRFLKAVGSVAGHYYALIAGGIETYNVDDKSTLTRKFIEDNGFAIYRGSLTGYDILEPVAPGTNPMDNDLIRNDTISAHMMMKPEYLELNAHGIKFWHFGKWFGKCGDALVAYEHCQGGLKDVSTYYTVALVLVIVVSIIFVSIASVLVLVIIFCVKERKHRRRRRKKGKKKRKGKKRGKKNFKKKDKKKKPAVPGAPAETKPEEEKKEEEEEEDEKEEEGKPDDKGMDGFFAKQMRKLLEEGEGKKEEEKKEEEEASNYVLAKENFGAQENHNSTYVLAQEKFEGSTVGGPVHVESAPSDAGGTSTAGATPSAPTDGNASAPADGSAPVPADGAAPAAGTPSDAPPPPDTDFAPAP